MKVTGDLLQIDFFFIYLFKALYGQSYFWLFINSSLQAMSSYCPKRKDILFLSGYAAVCCMLFLLLWFLYIGPYAHANQENEKRTLSISFINWSYNQTCQFDPCSCVGLNPHLQECANYTLSTDYVCQRQTSSCPHWQICAVLCSGTIQLYFAGLRTPVLLNCSDLNQCWTEYKVKTFYDIWSDNNGRSWTLTKPPHWINWLELDGAKALFIILCIMMGFVALTCCLALFLFLDERQTSENRSSD